MHAETKNVQKIKKEETEEQVLDAAEALFGHYGLEKTSMDDIARTARKSKRSLYNYFSSKEEIFYKALHREIDRIKAKVNRYFAMNRDKHPLVLLKLYLIMRPEVIKGAVLFCQALKNKFRFQELLQSSEEQGIVQKFNQWEHSLFFRIGKSSCHHSKLPETEHERFAQSFADMVQMALQGMNYAFFVENRYDQYKDSYNLLINIIMGSIEKNSEAMSMGAEWTDIQQELI